MSLNNLKQMRMLQYRWKGKFHYTFRKSPSISRGRSSADGYGRCDQKLEPRIT